MSGAQLMFSFQRRGLQLGLPSSTYARRNCTCKDSKENNSEFLTRAQDLLKENPDAMKAVQRMDAAADKVEELKAKQKRLQEEADGSAKVAAEEQAKRVQQAEEGQAKRVQQALQEVSELETKAAEKAVEAARLETELLANEREAMRKELQQSSERIESGKAGAVGIVGGAVGLLPSGLMQQYSPLALFLATASGLATCALFGVLYRYVVAGDPQNTQLRGGAVAAFGLTRGLAVAQVELTGAQDWSLPLLASSALSVAQSMLMFAFAAAAIEAATSAGALKRAGDQ